MLFNKVCPLSTASMFLKVGILLTQASYALIIQAQLILCVSFFCLNCVWITAVVKGIILAIVLYLFWNDCF